MTATSSLPIPATSFVGRDDELTRIADLLADPNCRLLTLLGPGGIGKTRLALQAAADQSSFTDGIYFVSLTAVSSPDAIPSTVAGVLPVIFSITNDLRLQLIGYLREKRALLVMDNFEHLSEGVDFLTDILQAAPQIKFLVTSRERLNVQEEWVLALDGLAFPQAENNTPLKNYSAVQLFTQRACQVQANFSLDDNADAVRKICQQVEGMPLGLELAATWLRAMSPQQITAHMESNLGFLTTPLRNVTERHRSLYRVFEQSWKLLSRDEQNVLMRLSVFRGGFDLDAAQQVAGASLGILAGLADKSLIRLNREGRYDLHELLRQYTEQQLDAAGAAEAARTAHSAYYLRFVAQRDGDIKGRRQQAGLYELRTDLENIRASLLWAVDHEQYALIIAPVLDCIANFAEMGNMSVDIRMLLKQAEATLRAKFIDQTDPLLDQVAIRCEKLNSLTRAEFDHQQMEAILERARQRGDKHEIAYCLWVLGDYSSSIREFGMKVQRHKECHWLWREIGDDFYVAHTLVGLYAGYIRISRNKEAIEALSESVRIRSRIGDLNNLGFSLVGLSYHYLLEGRMTEREQVLNEALELYDEIGKLISYTLIKDGKAVSAFLRGEFDLTLAEVQDGSQHVDEQTYKRFRLSDAILSWVASMNGDYSWAYDLSQRRILTSAALVPEFDRFGLALAACGLGNDAEAGKMVNKLLTDAPSANSPTFRQMCLPIAAILAARANQPEWAAELLGLASAGPQEITGWMEKWPLLNEVRQQLEDQLGAEAFHTTWERGKTLQLDAVAQILVEQRQPGMSHAQPSASEMANRALTEPLSERELDVLRLIAKGYSNQEIADHLVISVTTVKKHANHIFGKLGVESRTQAIAHAQALNLL